VSSYCCHKNNIFCSHRANVAENQMQNLTGQVTQLTKIKFIPFQNVSHTGTVSDLGKNVPLSVCSPPVVFRFIKQNKIYRTIRLNKKLIILKQSNQNVKKISG
jgi:hypothetical protein